MFSVLRGHLRIGRAMRTAAPRLHCPRVLLVWFLEGPLEYRRAFLCLGAGYRIRLKSQPNQPMEV